MSLCAWLCLFGKKCSHFDNVEMPGVVRAVSVNVCGRDEKVRPVDFGFALQILCWPHQCSLFQPLICTMGNVYQIQMFWNSMKYLAKTNVWIAMIDYLFHSYLCIEKRKCNFSKRKNHNIHHDLCTMIKINFFCYWEAHANQKSSFFFNIV